MPIQPSASVSKPLQTEDVLHKQKQLEAIGKEPDKGNVDKVDKRSLDVNQELQQESADTVVQDEQKRMIKENVSRIENHVQNIQRDLQFSVNDETGDVVIKVFDSATKELVRQIPSEELLERQDLLDNMKGVLFNRRV